MIRTTPVLKNSRQPKLGDTVRCKITGFEGVITATTVWLSGCVRVAVQPPVDRDGKFLDERWFDIEVVDILDAPAVEINTRNTGGDQVDPRSPTGQ